MIAVSINLAFAAINVGLFVWHPNPFNAAAAVLSAGCFFVCLHVDREHE